jgi:peptidoglycan/xylan/chitin deacetylase (PgdA/CDA1 family)
MMNVARVGTKVAALGLGIAARRTGDVVVLCYHRVGSGQREIDVPADVFRSQLEAVAAEPRPRALADALADPAGGVVLTFDDGFRDFYETVLPLLVEYGLPAVLYLATGFVDVGDPRSNVSSADALTWRMLEAAVDTGLVVVGSHTHSHRDLSRVDPSVAEDEMKRSKELIEDRLGRPCRHFAFPWGRGSTGATAAARRLFDTAALDAWRTNRRSTLDPYNVGRVPVFRTDTGLLFRAKAQGRMNAERIAYRIARRGPWSDG